MGKKSSSPPPAPDPVATAQAQAAANKEAVLESAKVNQINEVTPYGSVTYTGDVGAPDRTKITELSPSSQLQLDQRNQLAELLNAQGLVRAGQISSDPFSLSGKMPTPGDYDTATMEQRQFDRAMSLMRPEFDRQERRFEQTMADRGLPIGAEAYDDARSQFDRSRDDAISGAAYNAMLAGQNEQSRLYNLDRTARGDQINEALLQRQQPMNELAAILQGAPAFQNPQFGGQAQYQVAPADVMGATYNSYQGALNNYNTQQQSNNAALGGLASLGGSLGSAWILASDRRLKRDIEPIGNFNGLNWYSFRYHWDDALHIGVMADEVRETHPEAVHELPSGYLAVDYGRLQPCF